MDSAGTRHSVTPRFMLSSHQRDLLLAALNSNTPSRTEIQQQTVARDTPTVAPMSLNESPLGQAPDSGTLGGLDDSPFIDYDYDFDADAGFDFDNLLQGQMTGKLLASSSDGDVDTHDKRGHPDDEENDEEGGGKRREGDDRSSKKPGRKPLTSEPTSKRKAQNRAAQRAFRERKEKHLKDLETKVQDLEKASESANHENSILRAQIEKLSVELREYKKRLSLSVNGRSPPPNQHSLPPFLAARGPGLSNPNDVNFQFEFPKFGKLPEPPVRNVSKMSSSSTISPPAPAHRGSGSSNNGSISPMDKSRQNTTGSSNSNFTQNAQLFPQLEGTDFSTLFTSGNLDSKSSDQLTNFDSIGTRSSEDSSRRQNSTGQSTSYNSPSASSNVGSNAGLSSSCGTSPEPYIQSPSAFKPNDNVLSTIGEEHPSGISEGEKSFREKLSMACGDAKNPVPRTLSENCGDSGLFDTEFNINGIDWLAQQNNNQFDPELFGDYREPQNNILSGGLYDDSFFADAFPIPDLSGSFNSAPSPALKKDLVTEIDQKLNEEDMVVPGEDRKTLLTCNFMWEKLQSCPKVQSGDIDMDSLCTQLQQKAKCSGEGPVINEKDFHEVINSILK